MTSRDLAAPAVRTAACCRRPMTSIEVTSPTSGARLRLHACTGCGQHVWERDGALLDRSSALGAVRDRIAEGPAPRAPRTPRTPAPRASRSGLAVAS